MADTIASALFGSIFNTLTDEAFTKFARSRKIHSELNELQNTLTRIEALLNDASRKEMTDKSVGLWLNNLRHLAYDIDDILDDVATEGMRRELTRQSGEFTSKVRNVIPTWSTNLSLSQSLHHKLDSIIIRLQDLENQKTILGLVVKDENQKSNNNRGKETSLLESDIVGREGEKEKFIRKLLGGDSSKENFSIVPIVGMGGVGKTTLARLLYNDERVKGQFELMAWVCVSDDFDIFKITENILQSLVRENQSFKDLNQLQTALIEQFKDKRFLLVLDDVWTENYDEWEKLVRPFRSCAPGSGLIVTTRKEQLLKKIGFDHMDHVEGLSDSDALCLLALNALGLDNFDSQPTLRSKGEGIVAKCGCLPLALKAIGRLLRTKTCEEDWDDVLNSEIWNLDNEILPALRLSYHDLPAHLKQLFAYCSLFPKDFLFDKEKLVLLWMAEGYLNLTLTNKAPEDLGHDYFEKLLSRSFFQYAPNDKSLYVMHDLMNNLATSVAREYFLRFDQQTHMVEEDLAKYHHMSFIREEYVGYQKFEAFERARNLRTLLEVFVGVEQSWQDFYLSNKFLVDLIPKLRLLRVLSLRRFHISEVPDFIGNLKHLRYLNLSQTKIRELPENVGNLYNLETLILFGCLSLTKLPESFLKLKKLRHFDARDTPLLKKLPLGIGELKSLQILTKIIIGEDNDFAITELKSLKHLNGEISIEGLHNVQSARDAREANLSQKRLSKLELKWYDGSSGGTLQKEVLNELKPHRDTLKELAVVSYGGTEFSDWVGDTSFLHLVHVSIRDCRKCTSLPSLGKLPSLKKLFIQGMDKVELIGSEVTGTSFVAFPSLEILKFEDMSGWETWSTKNQILDKVFPCLRELYIKYCPKLIDITVEALPTLRVLQVDRCGDGVLRHLVHAASSITKLEILSISGLTYEVWSSVIYHLGTVEELRIYRCEEIKYLWESEADASKVLVNLKKLYVYNCSSLVSLGEKEGEKGNNGSNLLSSLRILDVWHCNSMERCYCPNNIESLCIGSCSSLKRVSFLTEGGGQKLKSLDISLCNKQMEMMGMRSMPMLENAFVYQWTDLKSIISLMNSVHLTHLELYDCPGVKFFPDLQLPNLTSLTITGCKNLNSIPDLQLMNLTVLTDLEIRDCPSIDASFPGGHWPPNLITLEIGGLKKPISEWGFQNFPTSLVNLTLWDEPDVRNFSQLSHLLPSSLTQLRIGYFDKLESLSVGLQHLTSLQHLVIYYCPTMKRLPDTLLPSLLSLRIDECPNLQERCKGRGSRYWPLIYHIPCIEIEHNTEI